MQQPITEVHPLRSNRGSLLPTHFACDLACGHTRVVDAPVFIPRSDPHYAPRQGEYLACTHCAVSYAA